MQAFIEGLLAGYGIAIPVGAIAILIINSGLRCGFATGFAAGAGAASADTIYAALAIFAGAALALKLAPYESGLRLVSGLALVMIGSYGLRRGLGSRPQAEQAGADCAPQRTYLQFVLLTLVNPLTIVYFTAYILGSGAAAFQILSDRILFIAGAGLASLSWQSLLAGLGGLGKQRMPDWAQSAAIIAGNLLVIGLGGRAVLLAYLSG
jgi:arginine exporter protein ArgO